MTPEPAPLRILFVCSHNRRRSLTAERAFAGDPRFQARSAGTEPSARVRLTSGHLGWADVVFVMERRHADIIRQNFPRDAEGCRIVNLRVPDEFEYGDPALVQMLREAVALALEPDAGPL